MGSLFSKTFVVNTIPGQGVEVIDIANKLHLSRRDLNSIYTQFCILDSDHSGEVEVEEFIIHNDISSDIFGELVFTLFDQNKSGKLDFQEYVTAVWNYCTLPKDGLAKFAFDIFDVDNSGTLTFQEIKEVIDMIWGFKGNDRVTLALKHLTENNNKEISGSNFIDIAKHFPILLFPVFEVQDKLRKKCMGEYAWSRLTNQRYVDFEKKSVFEILGCDVLHADETMDYLVRRLSTTNHTDKIKRVSLQIKAKSMGNVLRKNTNNNNKTKASILPQPQALAISAAGTNGPVTRMSSAGVTDNDNSKMDVNQISHLKSATAAVMAITNPHSKTSTGTITPLSTDASLLVTSQSNPPPPHNGTNKPTTAVRRHSSNSVGSSDNISNSNDGNNNSRHNSTSIRRKSSHNSYNSSQPASARSHHHSNYNYAGFQIEPQLLLAASDNETDDLIEDIFTIALTKNNINKQKQNLHHHSKNVDGGNNNSNNHNSNNKPHEHPPNSPPHHHHHKSNQLMSTVDGGRGGGNSDIPVLSLPSPTNNNVSSGKSSSGRGNGMPAFNFNSVIANKINSNNKVVPVSF